MKHVFAVEVGGKVSQVAYSKLEDAIAFMRVRATDMDKDSKPEFKDLTAKYHYTWHGSDMIGFTQIIELEVME